MEENNQESNVLVFFVNGKKVVDHQIDPEWTLLYYLRNKLRLCGTKLGCGEGGCGACTVMVSKYDRVLKKVRHIAINACLAPVCSMHGVAVTTVEGIGSTKTKLHPVQERIAKAHGSQCGFCTPGFVMSMYTLLRNSPKPSIKELEIAFQGNLCRCTGYRPIMEGYKTFTEEWELAQSTVCNNNVNNGCKMGKQCCKLQGSNSKDVLFEPSKFIPFDPSQEPIFPPELMINSKYDQEYLIIKGKNVIWYRPTQLKQLLNLKSKFPDAKIVVGNTEIGVEVKYKNILYPIIIQPTQIKEMIEISKTNEGLRIGASATLNDVESYLKEEIKQLPEHKTRIFKTIVEMLHWFASKQIRSVGAIGSNIMTGSPISDLVPILMANEVKLELISTSTQRTVILDNNFFTGYRTNVMHSDEILLAIHLPYSQPNRHSYAFKQARRREDDIAIVNCAINVTFQPESTIIDDINLAFGGMSFKTVTAPKTRQNLKGIKWNQKMLEIAYNNLLEDLPLDYEAPGGMISYRRSLTLSLFFKGFLNISKQLGCIELDDRELSGAEGFSTKEYKSSQYFSLVPDTQDKSDYVERPLVHISAYKQATGEAIYCDDMPVHENELHLAYVTSTKSHAKIIEIDESEALAMEGVVYFVSAKDINEELNVLGSEVNEECIFYNKKVTSQGQIIGGIVAVDKKTAKAAVQKVKIVYEELKPVIISIKDAIKYNSIFENSKRVIQRGDVEKVMQEAPHVLENECYVGGQEHFYLESQACLAVPKKEDNEMEIFSSSQNPSEITAFVAKALGIQQNKVVTRVKRVGGGFGGKEIRATMIALPVAIAASKLNRPVRCMLDREDDIAMTGGRHPFLIKYKVAFNSSGELLAADVILYNNAGYSRDLSIFVMERAVSHFETVYKIPTVRIVGYSCKTNLPSNVAFRAFGAPQAMFGGETMMQNIADYLGHDSMELRKRNLFKEGDLTSFNQKLTNCTIEKCWNECINSVNYYQRKEEVKNFNLQNKYKKRGISIIPTKFGLGFPSLTLNQSGALVLVYTDGSVLLSHGGVEIGQGLYTKMIQVASRALGIPPEKIHTSETATDKVPNTPPTAGSFSSDLNGMAVLRACETIKERLRPYKEANPKGTWEDWVKQAYLDRVSLSATGFYKTPDFGYNFTTGEGKFYHYFTYGVAYCEVEIDTLTGDHQVHKVDIVMDVGQSLNPAIDIGQIEGGFMQGYGLFLLEELMYSPSGTIYTKGPGSYKLPALANIPGEFNVSLLKGASNPHAVYSSKGIGEPPLFLGSSVAFAIKDAIKASREENNLETKFQLDSPVTAAKIRMACKDDITLKIKEPESGTFQPWNVSA